MLRVYDEGIEYEDVPVEEGRGRQQHALRDTSNGTPNHSVTPKPPVCKTSLRRKRHVEVAARTPVAQGPDVTLPSDMTPILSQISSSFAVMNPMIIIPIGYEERERIKAMGMCIERYTCPCAHPTREDDLVVAWMERIHEFSEGPMMMDLNLFAFGREHVRMGKDSLRAVSTARRLIDGVYRFGDGSTGAIESPAKTSLYLYQMVICFTAIRHVENMEQALAERNQGVQMNQTEEDRLTMRTKCTTDVLGDESFHSMVATVCMEICAFMRRDYDTGEDWFRGGFPELTNTVGFGGCMMEILVALDWFIKAFYINLTESQTADDLSQTWLGRYSPTLAKAMIMPKIVLGYCLLMRERILEQGIFKGERSWLVQSTETDHPTRSIVQDYCTRHLKALLRIRVSLLVQNALATATFSGLSRDATGHQSRVSFVNAMVDCALELLYDSLDKGDAIWTHGHITRIVVCAIYCVSKAIDCPIRLVQLESLCFSCFPLHREEQDAIREWYSNTFFPESSIAMACTTQQSSMMKRLRTMYASMDED